MNECIPEVVKAMRACVKETGASKLFSANITADDPVEMVARGKYVLSQFGLLRRPVRDTKQAVLCVLAVG
jgi:ribulose-bisphosphate carboxylase large chain